MSDIAVPMPLQASSKPDLNAKSGPATAIVFILLLATGLLFTAYSLYTDVAETGEPITTYLPFVLLGVALFIALGFEFVDGFHDTANAVATVIYTHLLPPQFAVIWSGFSTGAVAFGIVSLLSVELILQVGSDAGFAMVFALLVAAIIWNLGTWSLLILIGTVPTTYALNRALPASHAETFKTAAIEASKVVEAKASGYNVLGNPRPAVTQYVSSHAINEGTYPSLAALMRDISDQVASYGSLAKIPAAAVGNTRNDMYLTSEAIRFLMKDKASELSPEEAGTLNAYKNEIDASTKFIPLWVKVVVAIALGLGTMIGWKRIVVTVGEKIGKQHLTYAQGASAELVAMATIGAADMYGLPVSTTHVLSSGVAGTMAANKSGLQLSTVRNLLMAWVLTLPMAIQISGSLFYVFSRIF